MSAEHPTPKDMPPRKRKPAVVKPAATARPVVSPLSEDRWLKGRAHLEAIRQSTCGCGTHQIGAYICMISSGVNKIPELEALMDKYTDINLKVHNSNREAGWLTPSQEAEEMLLFENKKKS